MNWIELIISGIVFVSSIWVSFHYQMRRHDKDQEENNKNFSTINNRVTEQAKDIADLRSEVKEDIADLRSEVKEDIAALDNKVTALDNKVSEVKKNIADVRYGLKEDISNVSGSLKLLEGYLQGQFSKKFPVVPLSDVQVSYIRAGGISATGSGAAKAASLLVLTSKYLEGVHRMGAEEIAKKYQHHIIVPNDANKLVIQQHCFDFVFSGHFLNLVNQKEKDIIQNEIDKSSKKEDETLIIFGILFRDLILKSRGLPVPVSSQETESPS